MPSLKGSKNHLIEGAKIEASSHKEATPNSQLNNQCEILEQLLPSSVTVQQKQQQRQQQIYSSVERLSESS